MNKVFVSYSRKDRSWVDLPSGGQVALLTWLREKLLANDIDLWWDDKLNERVGAPYEEMIRSRIQQSQTAVLLLSDDFFISRFIREFELPLIRERVESGAMQLFPIVVSHVDWSQNEFSLWVKRRQIHPSALTPLIEVVGSPSEWSKVRSNLSVALREQVKSFRPKTDATVSESGDQRHDKHEAIPQSHPGPVAPPPKPKRSVFWALTLAIAVAAGGIYFATRTSVSSEAHDIEIADASIKLSNELATISKKIDASGVTSAIVKQLDARITQVEHYSWKLSSLDIDNPRPWLCQRAQQLLDVGAKLPTNAKLSARFYAAALQSIEPESGQVLYCPNTSWAVLHYGGAFLAETFSEMSGIDRVKQAIEFTKTEELRFDANQKKYAFLHRLDSFTFLSRTFEPTNRALAFENAKLGQSICSINLTYATDFDVAIWNAVHSRCSELSDRVRRLNPTPLTDEAVAEILKQAESQHVQAQGFADKKDFASMTSSVEKGLQLVDQALIARPKDQAAVALRINLLLRTGFYNFWESGNGEIGLKALQEARRFSQTVTLSEGLQAHVNFELARTMYAINTPELAAVVSDMENDFDLRSNGWLAVQSTILVADYAVKIGDKPKAILYFERAIETAKDLLQKNSDQASQKSTRDQLKDAEEKLAKLK